jgi:hypothetical protein
VQQLLRRAPALGAPSSTSTILMSFSPPNPSPPPPAQRSQPHDAFVKLPRGRAPRAAVNSFHHLIEEGQCFVLTNGFLDRRCCGERRLGDGRGLLPERVVLEEARARLWAWTSACMRRSIRLACPHTSWPLNTTSSFTIPRSAHSAFLACAI